MRVYKGNFLNQNLRIESALSKFIPLKRNLIIFINVTVQVFHQLLQGVLHRISHGRQRHRVTWNNKIVRHKRSDARSFSLLFTVTVYPEVMGRGWTSIKEECPPS